MKTIDLPIFEIRIIVYNDGSGTISSNLHADEDACAYNAQIDIIEAMILAHACAGIDVTNESYLNGIQTVVDKISNNL